MCDVWLFSSTIVSKSHVNTWMWIQRQKNFNQKVNDLWPQIHWGHICDSPQRLVCLNYHRNTSKHVDIVTPFFKNFNQRSMTLRKPLTPVLHMCASTKWSFCPGPMGLHECIQLSIWQIWPHTTDKRHAHTFFKYLIRKWQLYKVQKKPQKAHRAGGKHIHIDRMSGHIVSWTRQNCYGDYSCQIRAHRKIVKMWPQVDLWPRMTYKL